MLRALLCVVRVALVVVASAVCEAVIVVAVALCEGLIGRPLGLSAILGASLVVWGGLVVLALVLFRRAQRERRVVRLAWFWAASLVVGYAVVDLGPNLMARDVETAPRMVADPVVHHRSVPNTVSRTRHADADWVQRVNNLGLRGPDIEVEKDAGTYRILMLGDSFTLGYGVSDDEAFPALIQTSLRQGYAGAGHANVEVLNGGVDSYAPILSYLQLTTDLWRLSPDLVVLNLDQGDLHQEEAYRSGAVYGPHGEPIAVEGHSRGWAAVQAWVNRHLHVTRLVVLYVESRLGGIGTLGPRTAIASAVSVKGYALLAHTLAEDTADREKQWNGLFDSILRIQRFCDERDVAFLMTVYPWGHQVSDDEWVAGRRPWLPEGATVSDSSLRRIEAFADESGIDLLNTFPAFRSYTGPAPLYHEYDLHWTPAGHALMAQQLAVHLAARGDLALE